MTNNLSDLEHVRQRPAMYIGDTGLRGLHQCVFELVDFASSRDATRISVSLNANGGVTVTDDGHSCEPGTLEKCMTDLQFANFQNQNINAGVSGFGIVVVNFLAMKCEVETSIAGESFRQSYCRGVAATPIERIGSTANNGMTIFIQLDAEIFKTIELQSHLIAKRLEELSCLRVGVRYSLADERSSEKVDFYSEQGARDFVRTMNNKTEPIHPVVALKGQTQGIQFDIAFQYTTTFRERTLSFGNDARSEEGGLHVMAFKRSIIRLLKHAGEKQGISLNSIEESVTFFDGLTSVIAVRLDNPLWQGSTKTKLANEELLPTITAALNAYLPAFFECNPITTKSILQKVQHSAERRKHLPPLDSNQFHQLAKRLTKPEEDPKGWGTTAWLPAAYQCRMQRSNGGEIRTQNEVWNLIPIRDESNAESLKRTRDDVIECTQRARGKPGIPDDAVVIAQNQQDDLLLFIRHTDRPCGEDYPNPFADAVYRWDHSSHELARIADDFDEIGWSPGSSENRVQN